MNFLTKKKLSALLIISVGIFFAIQWYLFDYFCLKNGVYGDSCVDQLFNIKSFVFFLGMLLSPVLLTLPLPQGAFKAWKWFAVFATPIIVVLSFYFDQSHSSGFFSISWGELLGPLMYVAYGIISLLIIIIASIYSWKHKNSSKQ